ncbi:hypothetical protein [Desulfovibrio aminophilus]|uniref:hypothetical protein n=1 Tax=Desulfovibrio aminophilus TaxID=81425 RepID=UPI003395A6CF
MAVLAVFPGACFSFAAGDSGCFSASSPAGALSGSVAAACWSFFASVLGFLAEDFFVLASSLPELLADDCLVADLAPDFFVSVFFDGAVESAAVAF